MKTKKYVRPKAVSGTLLQNKGNARKFEYLPAEGFEINTRIINRSHKTFIISERNGSYTTLLPAKPHSGTNSFNNRSEPIHIDNRVYILNRKSIYVGQTYLDECVNNPKCSTIRDRLLESNGAIVYTEEFFEIDLISRCRGGIYIKDYDLVISCHIEGEIPRNKHPESQKFAEDTLLRGNDNLNQGFHPNIVVVDNDKKYKSLYTIVFDRVIEIETIENNSLDNGIYITGFERHDEERRTEILDINDAISGKHTYDFYLTTHDAELALHKQNNGNSKDSLKVIELEEKLSIDQKKHNKEIEDLKYTFTEKERVYNEKISELSSKARTTDKILGIAKAALVLLTALFPFIAQYKKAKAPA